MASIPGMRIVEPVTSDHARAALRWAIDAQGPVYFRLRRTPADVGLGDLGWQADAPIVQGMPSNKVFVVSGTQSLRLVQRLRKQEEFSSWGLIIPTVLSNHLDPEIYRDLLAALKIVVTVEEDLAPGTLYSLVSDLLALEKNGPRILGKALNGWGASFRKLDACLAHFGFTEQAFLEDLRHWEVLG